jgi:hypothetical protein
MLDLCKKVFGRVIDLLRSRATLEAEVLVLRQRINVLRRASPKRRPFGAIDRLILGGVCRLFPESYDALAIVRPDTVIRWHAPVSDCIGAGNRDLGPEAPTLAD